MVTGVEAAGLALAMLPLLVNQLDAYVRGIEKIKLLRRYKREFADYLVALETQNVILLNNLEEALEGVVDDGHAISDLISNPRGEGWKDPMLQKRLRFKMGRNYEVFVANTVALSELLGRLSRKLELDPDDMKSINNDVGDIWKFRKVLSKAVFDELLAKVDTTNNTIKILIEQSQHQERSRTRRQPYTRLLQRYKKARKDAEGLFNAIIRGDSWRCPCREDHCVHFQLQTNPEEYTAESFHSTASAETKFQMIFSNNARRQTATELWNWIYVNAATHEVENITSAKIPQSKVQSINLNTTCPVPTTPRKKGVRFKITERLKGPSTTEFNEPEKASVPSSCQPISDICASLRVAEAHTRGWEMIGHLSSESDSSICFSMYGKKGNPKSTSQKSIQGVLSQLSRRDRLRIAAGLARGVIQFHGNWLKSEWNNSDVRIAPGTTIDPSDALPDNLYLSWSITQPNENEGLHSTSGMSGRNDNLIPLGLALIELSLGKSVSTLLNSGAEDPDELFCFRTPSKLINMVSDESGMRYAEAVDRCLSWSGSGALCKEKRGFEETVFDSIFCPILKTLLEFENLE